MVDIYYLSLQRIYPILFISDKASKTCVTQLDYLYSHFDKIAILTASKTCVTQLGYLYGHFDKIAVLTPSKTCVTQLDYLYSHYDIMIYFH